MGERVVVRQCGPQESSETVVMTVLESVQEAVRDTEKLASARKVLVKGNLGIDRVSVFKDRPTTTVDPDVFEGVCRYLRDHTDAEILYGDGMDGAAIEQAVRDRGYASVGERYDMRLIDMHAAPYEPFEVSEPAMFSRYTLSRELLGVDYVVSVAKMKSHHLCGVTLSQKNLFGLPPGPVYGSPRIALHSPIRLPLLLVDLARLFPPDLCVIDGIIGGNFSEWQGDPVSSGLIVSGTNCVAVDATAARLMHVDPTAGRGVSPFIAADNHIRVAHEHSLGPIDSDDIEIVGDPPDRTLPYSTSTPADPEALAESETRRRRLCLNAGHYFERWDEYADRYDEKLVVLDDGEVIFDAVIDHMDLGAMMKPIQDRSLSAYEVFVKLVEHEEVELSEPYAVARLTPE